MVPGASCKCSHPIPWLLQDRMPQIPSLVQTYASVGDCLYLMLWMSQKAFLPYKENPSWSSKGSCKLSQEVIEVITIK